MFFCFYFLKGWINGIPIWMLGLGTRIAKKMVTKKIVEKGLDYLTGEDDYNAMRASDGYMEDWDKRKMVLEYLNRKRRREEMEKLMKGRR